MTLALHKWGGNVEVVGQNFEKPFISLSYHHGGIALITCQWLLNGLSETLASIMSLELLNFTLPLKFR